MHNLGEMLSAFAYPPCFLAGLLGGLMTRRWYVAIAIGFAVAPVLDIIGNIAFSDPEPHPDLAGSLEFGVIGALAALLVWGIRRQFRRSRAKVL